MAKYDFDIEKIIKEVTDYDKEFNVHVKHRNPGNEPEGYVQVTCSNFQMYLAGAICTLNGIKTDDYFYSSDYGIVCGPIGPKFKEFKNISKLEWDDRSKFYQINSMEFRYRFLTLILSSIMYRVENIAEKKQKKSGTVFMFYENMYFFLINIIEDTQKMIRIYLRNGSRGSSNILLKVHQSLVYERKGIEPRKLNKKIRECVSELRLGLNHEIFSAPSVPIPEDIAISQTLKLAYMLATNKYNFNNLPKFKKINGISTNNDLRDLIRKLGDAIISETKYKKRPMMYKAFNDARPLIYSRYTEINHDYPLSVGCRALEYTKFIIQDDGVCKFIDKMTK